VLTLVNCNAPPHTITDTVECWYVHSTNSDNQTVLITAVVRCNLCVFLPHCCARSVFCLCLSVCLSVCLCVVSVCNVMLVLVYRTCRYLRLSPRRSCRPVLLQPTQQRLSRHRPLAPTP